MPTDNQMRILLKRLLFERFNESELKDLYFDLDIDYESLPGQEKKDKARELINYCQRRDRVREVIHYIERERPDIPLPRDERTRKPIYTLPETTEGIQSNLIAWPNLDNIEVSNGALFLKGTNSGAVGYLPVEKLRNCGVEYEMMLTEYGRDPWAGIVIRGYELEYGTDRVQHPSNGHFVFLRDNGLIVFHDRKEIAENQKMIPDYKRGEWSKVKVEVIDDHIRIWAKDEIMMDRYSERAGAAGDVYLQAHYSGAYVRNLKVYAISPRS